MDLYQYLQMHGGSDDQKTNAKRSLQLPLHQKTKEQLLQQALSYMWYENTGGDIQQ